ncbi:unnamed protein product [Arabidopsis arenosa]|uniref:Uncharacterized protein n=1 Tax=Arabidopsis arenosa TaxID=38785 RepID=A0A8S2AXJ5_ARAAE|nr:unnamed protein product [Arabidopsis arenosa]
MDKHTKSISSLLISLWLTALLIVVDVVTCARQHHKSFLAKEADLVTDLPGQPDVSFKHYAGYVPVDKSNGRALFYWFFEAMDLPKEKPLVLWLNGGPGCSSVGYGATQEIGPFLADTEKGLIFNPYAWNKEVNMLFLESPVGVGFSYSNTSSDYLNLDDHFAKKDAYTFLCNWFEKFPELRRNDFYIAGESYADDLRGWVDYAWSHAVISDETHRMINRLCNFSSDDVWNKGECNEAIAQVDKQYNEIDIYSLYTSVCKGDSPQSSYVASAQFKTNYHISSKRMLPTRRLAGYDPCLDDYVKIYYNRADVQKALHASDGVNLKNWSICNMEIFHNWTYVVQSVLPIYEKLIAGGLRIWVYSGDTDGCVPVLGTRYSLNALGLPIKTAWRPWYHEKQVSGWVQEYEGLTFATFRGAGHAVPSFKPSSSLAFFSTFLKGVPLSTSRVETEIKN